MSHAIEKAVTDQTGSLMRVTVSWDTPDKARNPTVEFLMHPQQGWLSVRTNDRFTTVSETGARQLYEMLHKRYGV